MTQGELPVGVDVGSLAKRLAAQLIDAIPVLVLSGVCGLVAALSPAIEVLLVAVVACSILLLGYALLVWWMLAVGGASPGMQMMKLQLVGRNDGKVIGWGRAFLRQLILLACAASVVGLIALIVFLLMNPLRQGWHDQAASSLVISERTRPPVTARTVTARKPVSSSSVSSTVGLPPHLVGQQAFSGERDSWGPLPAGAIPQAAPVPTNPVSTTPVSHVPGSHEPPRAATAPRVTAVEQPGTVIPTRKSPHPASGAYVSPPRTDSAPTNAPAAPLNVAATGTEPAPSSARAPQQPGPVNEPPTRSATPAPQAPLSPSEEAARWLESLRRDTPRSGIAPDAAAPQDVQSRGLPSWEPPVPPIESAPGLAASAPVDAFSPSVPVNRPVTATPLTAGSDDYDSTHLARPAARTAGRWSIRLDDGREFAINGTILIGRNPAGKPGEDVAEFVTAGVDGRMVSKTHLAVGIDQRGVYVMDRGSTNGTAIATASGGYGPCAAGDRVRVRDGQIVSFGDHTLVVRRSAGS